MTQKRSDSAPIEPREFRSSEEINSAITKLQRRIKELEDLNIQDGVVNNTGVIKAAESNIRETIREVFGQNSPEFREFEFVEIWGGSRRMRMNPQEIIHCRTRGRVHMVGRLKSLVGRLEEKRADLGASATVAPSTNFDRLNLHPRIREVSRDLFVDGHASEAVFAASKALINYVKERSGNYDLDGAPLVRAVFSRNNPVLAFNDLADQTELDQQEGMMHLFEGAVLAIRNPGGHTFPEGSEQRAIEYISFLSLLAYRVQEAVVRKKP